MKKLFRFVTSIRFLVVLCMMLVLLLLSAMTIRINNPESFGRLFDNLLLAGAWTVALFAGILREIVVARAVKESKVDKGPSNKR